MARFLALAEPQASTQLAVIAGDIEGGGLLKRLGVLFTDYAFFCGVDNDLAVDTDSMYAGIAQHGEGARLFRPGTDHCAFQLFPQRSYPRGVARLVGNRRRRANRRFHHVAGRSARRRVHAGRSRVRLMIPRGRDGAASDANLPDGRRVARHHGLVSLARRQRSRLVRSARLDYRRSGKAQMVRAQRIAPRATISRRKNFTTTPTVSCAIICPRPIVWSAFPTTGVCRSTNSPKRLEPFLRKFLDDTRAGPAADPDSRPQHGRPGGARADSQISRLVGRVDGPRRRALRHARHAEPGRALDGRDPDRGGRHDSSTGARRRAAQSPRNSRHRRRLSRRVAITAQAGISRPGRRAVRRLFYRVAMDYPQSGNERFLVRRSSRGGPRWRGAPARKVAVGAGKRFYCGVAGGA